MSPFKEGLFTGKNVFVAGGTSGINLGIAQKLAAFGAKVTVCGRNPEKAEAAARSIGGADKALGLSCDVRDYAAIRAGLEKAVETFGKLDFVVSGAAGNFLAPAETLSANGFRTVVDIDLMGTFNVFRACKDLLNTPGASLIAITAGQAVNASLLQVHACAAKAGVNQVVRVLAMEWGPQGIRVNGISPGPISGTEGMSRLAPGENAEERQGAHIPLRRWGKIEEVADAAVWLCSSAATYVTGTIIDVDGGSQLGDASLRTVGTD